MVPTVLKYRLQQAFFAAKVLDDLGLAGLRHSCNGNRAGVLKTRPCKQCLGRFQYALGGGALLCQRVRNGRHMLSSGLNRVAQWSSITIRQSIQDKVELTA